MERGLLFGVVILGWILSLGGMAFGVWYGITEVMAGNVAGGVAVGLLIFFGGQFLAFLLYLLFIALADR